jgi:hypothetical protein
MAENAELVGESASSVLTSLPLNFPVINGEMSVQERVEAIENLSDFLRGKALELSDLDVSALPGSEKFVQMAVDAIEEAYSKVIPNIVSLMSTALLDHEEVPSQTGPVEDYEEGDTAMDNQYQRRTRKRNNQDGHEHQGEKDQSYRSNQSKNGFRNKKISDHFGSKYHHILEHQDAILNGDERHLKKLFSSLKATHDRHAGGSSTSGERHGRRTQEQSPDEYKLEQCKQLVKCTSGMSLYDMLVYFFSDDIDPTSGEIDDSIIKFDEANMRDKISEIQKFWRTLEIIFDYPGRRFDQGVLNLGTGLIHDGAIFLFREDYGIDLDDFNVDWACDELLEQFHRTVEFDGVPQWEGGIVNQVCLAEGTNVYVDLADIFTKLDQNIFSLGDTVAVVEYVQEFQYQPLVDNSFATKSFADDIVNDVLTCAEELFNSANRMEDANFADEEFVFRRTDDERSDLWRIPYTDRVYRDTHGQIQNNAQPTPSAFRFVEINRGSGERQNFIALDMDPFCSILTCEWRAPELDAFYASMPEDGFFPSACKEYLGKKNTFRTSNFFPCLSEEDPEEGAECKKRCQLERYEGYYDAITKGLARVFGAKTSVGFICGIKEGVVEDGNKLPGYCCLDAPYQLDNNYWGSEVSLKLENVRPLKFSKMLTHQFPYSNSTRVTRIANPTARTLPDLAIKRAKRTAAPSVPLRTVPS